MNKKKKKIESADSLKRDEIKKELFNERFKRLKYAFGVHSDSDLAKSLGISQQAVYAAKQRHSIPSKWLDVALSKNVSTLYIMEGDDDVIDAAYAQCSGRGERLDFFPEDRANEKPIGEHLRDETNVAKQLVNYVTMVNGKKIDPSAERFILHNIRRYILPNVVAQINDEIDELQKIMLGSPV
ncbi:MAG: helix-turn-helix domain-containing protein [Desulfobacteraceae bacterium]|jgi:hypothetical protein